MSENTQNSNIFREIGTIAALLVLFGLMVILCHRSRPNLQPSRLPTTRLPLQC